MKFRHVLMAAAMVLTVVAGCKKQKEALGITATPKLAEFTAEGGTATILVNTASAWDISLPDAAKAWLTVSPVSGSGDATVTLTASPNAGKPRSVVLTFKSGIFSDRVNITQEGKQKAGDGKSPETAFTASEANEWVNANISGNNEPSPEKMYVKGFIHKIGQYKGEDQYFSNNSYGNATFYMSDNKEYGADEKDFEAYQVYYLGYRKFIKGKDTDIKVGDEVIIYGHLTKYNDTAETMGQGDAYIYSLNGKVEEAQTEITDATVADFIKSDGATYYRLTGKVSSFKTGTNNSGKNYMQFNLKDDTGTILVYGFKDGEYEKWSGTIEDGGTVVLTGTYEFYEKNSQHEVMNATIESFTPGQVQTEITDATVADFIKSDGATYYRLTGKVSSFKTGTNSSGKNYMQFDLTDATGTILVYGFKDGQYDQWAGKIKDYGTVVLTGTYEFYEKNSQHEVMNATIESFTEGSAPTTFEDLTVAAFIEKADPSTPYRLKGIVEEFKITDASKGYLSFNLTDETGSILVYSLAEGQFAEWSDKLSNGGDIVLVGTYKVYQGTPEVVNATIESFEANEDYTYLKATPAEIRVKASATSTSFTVSSNKEWTIESDNQAFVPTPASGSGESVDVTVAFPANTEDAEKTAVLTITCGEKTVTVTIIQASVNAVPTDTVTAAIAADDDAQVEINDAIVAALSTKGFIVTDGENNVYVYCNGAPNAKLGDAVSIKGKKTTYYGLPQISSPTVTVASSGNEIPRTAVVELGKDNIDTYASGKADYLCVIGKLEKNGNYWNVKPEGATRYASPDYMISSIDPSALEGQQVKLYGYFNTIHSNNNYVKVIATEFLPADENVKYLSVSPDVLQFAAAGGELSLAITANQAWTVSTQDQFLEVSPASGEGNGTVTVICAENPAETGRTGSIIINGADNKTIEIAVSQGAKLPEGAGEVTITAAALTDGVLQADGFTLTFAKNSGSTAPTYNTANGDLRLYAKGTLTIDGGGVTITKLVFNLSAQGLKRLPPITCDTGSIAAQSKGDETVTWTGSATKVTLTVGDKADYGSDGSDKAGQLDFNSVVISYTE